MGDPCDFRNKVAREMISGIISVALLSIIERSEGPIYGYLIIRRMRELTGGSVRLREGTVYPILRYLQSEGFLASYLGESPRGAPRKYYSLTHEGRSALKEGLEAWKELKSALEPIIERGDENARS